MTRKAMWILACCASPLAISATGCGRFKKPSTVVHSLYMDCNNGEYPKARALFVAVKLEDFDGALNANAPGINGGCDRLTHSRTLTDVQITDVVIQGEKATVFADAHFSDGTAKLATPTKLVVEAGAWKVIE